MERNRRRIKRKENDVFVKWNRRRVKRKEEEEGIRERIGGVNLELRM